MRGQIRQVFSTTALLTLLVVGGLALSNLFDGTDADHPMWLVDVGVRLGIAVCNILLLENLYFNTPPDVPLALQPPLHRPGRHVPV